MPYYRVPVRRTLVVEEGYIEVKASSAGSAFLLAGGIGHALPVRGVTAYITEEAFELVDDLDNPVREISEELFEASAQHARLEAQSIDGGERAYPRATP